MGHDMFISCVLKIPSEARFPVWKVHFQKEIQDFSSVGVSLQNRTENMFRRVPESMFKVAKTETEI